LGGAVSVGYEQSANLCLWDDSLLGKTIRASFTVPNKTSFNIDFNFNGDTGLISRNIDWGKTIKFNTRFFRNGYYLSVYCRVYITRHGHITGLPVVITSLVIL
jgi:hypothetical protein